VHKDGNAHAVYLASYSDNHPDRVVSIAAGLGPWGDGAMPEDRVAFALQLRNGPASFSVAVVGPVQSPWANAAFLGRTLTREEALSHPLVSEAFHLTDHMVLEDEPIRRYLTQAINGVA
jgi:hypothetical protein